MANLNDTPGAGVFRQREVRTRKEKASRTYWNELEGNRGRGLMLRGLANGLKTNERFLFTGEFSESAFDGGNELEAILNLMFA